MLLASEATACRLHDVSCVLPGLEETGVRPGLVEADQPRGLGTFRPQSFAPDALPLAGHGEVEPGRLLRAEGQVEARGGGGQGGRGRPEV